MTEQRLADHALELGASVLCATKGLEQESPFVGEVRGKGLMIGVEFVKDQATREPAPELASRVRTLCHRLGLFDRRSAGTTRTSPGSCRRW